MNIFLPVIFLFIIGKLALQVSSYIHLWFVKEYRYDRMLIHLQTKQGKQLLFLAFKRPPVSPKTIALAFLSVGSLFLLYQVIPGHYIFRAILLYLLAFPLVSIWVGLLKIPTLLFHEYMINVAVNKLDKRELFVIGITGSFGKTSTKEFLYTILSEKYNVLKTEGSQNSPIAIAETIVHKLKPEHKIFLVEMGAYKRGEIGRMAQMVKPQVGIITAINEQHQDLFGTIESTVEAKYELILGLTGKKIGIFNGDNKYTLGMGERAMEDGVNVWWFTKANKKIRAGKVVSVSESSWYSDHLTFTVLVGEKKKEMSAALLGEHQINNILAAVSAALASPMVLDEIALGVAKIKPFSKTMQPIKGINGSTFINDTFNNNPDAAIAALNYLDHMTGKKILVFQPMIELGDFSVAAHEKVGQRAAQVCDGIFLTNLNFNDAFLQGVRKVNPKKIILTLSAKDIAQQLKDRVKRGDTVVFKGKEADTVLKYLQ